MKRNLFPTHKPYVEDLGARTKAIEEAIDMRSATLLSYFVRKTRDSHIAEDLLQTLWIKVCDSFKTEQVNHLPLLRRKAQQVLIDYQRRQRVRGFVVFTSELPESDAAPIYPEDGTPEADKALQKKFWGEFSNIEELTSKQREAFWLKERYGYSLEEISRRLDAPISTVHDWIKRVKVVCAARLNQEDKL